MVSIISHSPEETFEAGNRLADELRAGDVIALDGDLGAGKTHFTKGLAHGLGVELSVTSPTFTLVHEYSGGRLSLFHFDFYRLENEEDIHRIGLEDYLSDDGVLVIEWASRFPHWLPKHTRWFQLSALDGDQRKIEESLEPPVQTGV